MSRLTIILALTCLLNQFACAKICYDYCTPGDQLAMRSVDIVGCRRRSSYVNGLTDFTCQGQNGPPCTVRRGDTVVFNTTINADFSIKEMTQDVRWVTSLMEFPWPGLDTKGCNHLEGNCKLSSANRDLNFAYNINIMQAYPPGFYPIRWSITSRDAAGNGVTLGCMLIKIRIV